MKKTSVGLAGIIKNSSNSIKKMTGVSIGFHDPDTWISTGNYALNYLISGEFHNGIPPVSYTHLTLPTIYSV